MIVAIDGPAGSGKSTTARLVAARTGFLHLDTGAMYRAVTLAWLRSGLPLAEAQAPEVLDRLALRVAPAEGGMRVWIGEEEVTGEIRTPAVTASVSAVSAMPAVREAMVAEQRRLAKAHVAEGGGVVLDGRDIGTVVFPDAPLKIYLVADVEERARRRRAELETRGETVAQEAVQRDLERRDAYDSQRIVAPLRPADDAVLLDTTRCSIPEQVEEVVRLIRERQPA